MFDGNNLVNLRSCGHRNYIDFSSLRKGKCRDKTTFPKLQDKPLKKLKYEICTFSSYAFKITFELNVHRNQKQQQNIPHLCRQYQDNTLF